MPAMRRISAYSSSVSGQIVMRVFLRNLILRSSLFSRSSVKCHLPRQALDGAQVHHHFLGIVLVGIGVRVAAHFREGIDRVLGLAVIGQGPVAFVDLLELAQCVRTIPGVAPHFLALYEQGIPVVHAWVYGEQPASWFGGRLRHPSKSGPANYTRKRQKMANFMVNFSRNGGSGCEQPISQVSLVLT